MKVQPSVSPAAEPGLAEPLSRRVEESDKEPDVERRVPHHPGGGPGPAAVQQWRRLRPLSPRGSEVQEQG